jgi:hypothetical protein
MSERNAASMSAFASRRIFDIRAAEGTQAAATVGSISGGGANDRRRAQRARASSPRARRCRSRAAGFRGGHLNMARSRRRIMAWRSSGRRAWPAVALNPRSRSTPALARESMPSVSISRLRNAMGATLYSSPRTIPHGDAPRRGRTAGRPHQRGGAAAVDGWGALPIAEWSVVGDPIVATGGMR